MNKICVMGLVFIFRFMVIFEIVSNDLKIIKEDYFGNKLCMGVKYFLCFLYYLVWFVFFYFCSCYSFCSVWFVYNDGSCKVDIWIVCLVGY